MPERRILILYLHEHSGHHRAALALEKAFKEIDPKIKCRSVDALRYTHPLLEKLIQGTYLQIVKSEPEVWERLYDNPLILKTIQKLRLATYRSESKRFKAFLEDFRPSAVLCTQAFPCGVVSDYKSTCSGLLPLYGVLTDFFPHAYWPAENVNGYFVPAEEAKGKLRERGVASDKIFVTGIPVDVFNRENHDASSNVPLVLVMGGSQGIGPLEKIVDVLDDLKPSFEMAVVAGKNKRLYRRLQKRADRFKKKVEPFGYTQEVPRLMRRAALLVSKPGGLTTAEALALGLPIIFIDPIPGQEAKNAALLLKYGAALEARSAEETGALVERLFQEPRRMEAIRKQMALLARPDAALAIAQQVLDGELAF